MDKNMIAMCGGYCGDCDWKERMNCQGCQANQGKLFWGECQIAKCCMDKGYLHCGYCSELPCELLRGAFENEEHGDNGERLMNLRNWAQGDETVLKLTKRKQS